MLAGAARNGLRLVQALLGPLRGPTASDLRVRILQPPLHFVGPGPTSPHPPARDPAEWRGVGGFLQGGSGRSHSAEGRWSGSANTEGHRNNGADLDELCEAASKVAHRLAGEAAE